MNKLTINLQNVSNEDKKILMEIMERSNKPKSKVWKPVEGETVYALWANGEITEVSYHRNPLPFAYEQGNIFPTRNIAEFESERRKFLKRWKDLSIESGELENEWSGANLHWHCYYECSTKRILYSCHSNSRTANIYFATRESLKRAIKEIGEETVKKYILGVRE